MTLQTCLTTLMRHNISMEQLRLDVGHMVEKMTQITIMFRRIKLKMEEYVCLKVYILLNKGMLFIHISHIWHLQTIVEADKLITYFICRSRIGGNSRAIHSSDEELFATYCTK